MSRVGFCGPGLGAQTSMSRVGLCGPGLGAQPQGPASTDCSPPAPRGGGMTVLSPLPACKTTGGYALQRLRGRLASWRKRLWSCVSGHGTLTSWDARTAQPTEEAGKWLTSGRSGL